MIEHFDWPGFLPAFGQTAEAAGFASTVLTTTADGPLTVWERPAAGPRIYISAGIHGDEPAGPLALLELLAGGALTTAIHWLLCPALNPTGLARNTRTNAAGLDLNRDYRTLRATETRAHASWIESNPLPDVFLSLHEDWEARGFYFYEINLGPDQPERARRILAAASAWFEPEPGPEIDGHTPRGPGWIYHEAEADVPEGWPEAIFLAKLGCPLSFTFETPSRARLSDRVAAQCHAAREVFR
jgi:protein MpaA